MEETGDFPVVSDTDASVLVLDAESQPERVAERLREAVKRGGGHGAVAARSGIKSRTLSYLLGGQEAKQRQLVALADACGVSLEWLATGRGEMVSSVTVTMRTPDGTTSGRVLIRPSAPEPPPAGQSVAAATRRKNTLFGTLDMTRMGNALKAAAQAFQDRGVQPSWRRLIQVAAILYDAEDDPSDTIRAHDAAGLED